MPKHVIYRDRPIVFADQTSTEKSTHREYWNALSKSWDKARGTPYKTVAGAQTVCDLLNAEGAKRNEPECRVYLNFQFCKMPVHYFIDKSEWTPVAGDFGKPVLGYAPFIVVNFTGGENVKTDNC